MNPHNLAALAIWRVGFERPELTAYTTPAQAWQAAYKELAAEPRLIVWGWTGHQWQRIEG